MFVTLSAANDNHCMSFGCFGCTKVHNYTKNQRSYREPKSITCQFASILKSGMLALQQSLTLYAETIHYCHIQLKEKPFQSSVTNHMYKPHVLQARLRLTLLKTYYFVCNPLLQLYIQTTTMC